MTTHYEKIQALGNRMASNLETMGVSASFGDGGLTLADKILQIQHFTDGLLVWGDKDIIQKEDTVNLYALLLENGKAVSDETIFFYDDKYPPISYDTTGTHSIDKHLDDSFKVYFYPKSNYAQLNFQNSNDTIRLALRTNGEVDLWDAQRVLSKIFDSYSYLELENGILSNGEGDTYDLSDYDNDFTLSSMSNKGVAFIDGDCIGSAVTNSSGVATVGYTGKGAGLLNIKAGTIDSIIQSEPYPVIDAKSYDDGTGTISDYWIPSSVLTRNDDGTTTFSAGSYTRSSFKVSNSQYIDFENGTVIEFDAIEITGASVRIDGYDSDYHGITVSQTGHWKVIFKDGYMTAYVDGSQFGDAVAFDTTISTFRVSFRSSNATSTLKFDNFLLY